MNIEYVEPLQYGYPQTLDNSFDCKSHALVCSFNRLGTLLAIGCLDGNIIIYDFIAKTISKTIQAHTYFIHSLSWSDKSDIILSCSIDYSICLWSTITSQCLLRLNCFQTFSTTIYFHPKDSNLILINFFQHYPILLNRKDYLIDKILIDNSVSSLPTDGWISIFNHDGNYILTGNIQGKLNIFLTLPNLKIIQSGLIDQHRTCSIKQICISKQSKYLAILLIDKIRIYQWEKLIQRKHTNEYECHYILFDHVMKMKFMKINFSSDGEYICAASTRQHRLYIWETFSGSLLKILDHDQGKSLSDIRWHPYRPILISISDGILYTWSYPEYEIFPFNFHHINKNIIYHEHENEFDVNKSELTINNNEQQMINEDDDDDEFIDIISIESFRIPSGSECEYLSEEDIICVPTDPISDEDEETTE